MQFTRRKNEKATPQLDEKWGTEFYEKLYNQEIDLREKILGRLTTPLAIFVSISGAMLFMLRSYASHDFNFGQFAFWAFFGVSCCVLIAAAYHLSRAWWNNRYQIIPTASDLYDYHHKALANHYAAYPNANELADNAFSHYLTEKYCSMAACNAATNSSRTRKLFLANGLLLLASMLVLVTYAIFYYYSLDKNADKIPEKISEKQQISQASISNIFLLHCPCESCEPKSPKKPPKVTKKANQERCLKNVEKGQ